MTVWSVLRNIGVIIQVFRAIGDIISKTAKSDHKIPTCDDTRECIRQVRKLLDSGVIDVDGVDEKEVSKILGDIESNIVCAVDNTHRNVAAYGSPKGRNDRLGDGSPA